MKATWLMTLVSYAVAALSIWWICMHARCCVVRHFGAWNWLVWIQNISDLSPFVDDWVEGVRRKMVASFFFNCIWYGHQLKLKACGHADNVHSSTRRQLDTRKLLITHADRPNAHICFSAQRFEKKTYIFFLLLMYSMHMLAFETDGIETYKCSCRAASDKYSHSYRQLPKMCLNAPSMVKDNASAIASVCLT